MSNTALRVENISKRYRIGLKQELHDTFIGALTSWIMYPLTNFRQLRRLSNFSSNEESEDIIWALKDVSFEVKHGEVLGIIGLNGAGKSTLLKILCRVTDPTAGRAEIHGRVSSLLEVGTGFHPQLTGRENIFLNGAILGMTKKEIEQKFDEIVDFSGVEKFIDTPVKRYSSGMYVRLAFAVAAHLEPEILLVDEVLAVGDVAFQKKCLGKMENVAREGRTVLFVSHNMAKIRQLCPQCLWLDNGQIRQMGEPSSVIEAYVGNSNESGKSPKSLFEEDPEKQFQLRAVRVLNKEGSVTENFSCDEPIIIEFIGQVHQRVPGLYAHLSILQADGIDVMVSDSFDAAPNPLDDLQVGMHLIRVTIPARTLGHGDYLVSLNFNIYFSARGFNVDNPGRVCGFHLDDFTSSRGNHRGGFFSTLLSWDISSNSTETFIKKIQ